MSAWFDKKIYFDNGSTSWPKAPGVGEAMASFLEQGAFNINRGNYEGAYEVESIVLDTRDKLARLFGCSDSRRVIFTPGITWSLNMFIKGLLLPGDHVIVSGLEHNAVMRPLEQMKEVGVSYDIAPVDESGRLDPEELKKLIKANTKAVIMTQASNVCGTLLPIKDIGKICRERDIFFAVDSAQSAGSIPIEMEEWGIDFLAFTGHKGLLGPQGIGGFLVSEALDKKLKPIIAGGTGSVSDSLIQPKSLPDKYESGTMNLPGIVGLHAALSYLEDIGIDRLQAKKMAVTSHFLSQLNSFSNIRVVGECDVNNRTAVVSVDFGKVDNALCAFTLEQEFGIMTRVGLHCAPTAHRSLHTFPQGTVRFSFGAQNTVEEADRCIEGVQSILERYENLDI